MQGKIVLINQIRGLYYVECDDSTYSIFELLGSDDINLEDIIRGELDQLGGCTLYNISTNESIEALIEDVGVSVQTVQANLKSSTF